MTFHANRGLYHRAVLDARQDTSSRVARPIPTRSTSSSSARSTTSSATSISRPSSSSSISRTTSSSLVSTPSSTSKSIVSTPQAKKSSSSLTTTTTSSTSSVSSSVATAASAAKKTTRKGSLVGIIIGIFIAILVIIILAIFITRKIRKRRERRNEAHFFNKDMLERPGMVQGIAAGPGVSSLKGVENENASQSSNIERTLPPSSLYPFDPSRQNIADLPASPYGSGNPYSTVHNSGSSLNFNQSQLELGAPPMPGNSSPAPYSPYMANFYKYAPPSQITPPGSPFGARDRMQNPFATPSATDTHPSTPISAAAWPHTPIGSYHLPLLPGGAFSNDSYRDSGYSAAYSEVQVGQAYKVQVGHSMPKYGELTTKDTPGSPPPPFTPFDAAASANTTGPAGPATMADKTTAAATHKSLPPRPLSTHTIYNPEDAYGGV